MRFNALTRILLAFTLGLGVLSCADKKIPNLPTAIAIGETDTKAAIEWTYNVLDSLLDTLTAASKLEKITFKAANQLGSPADEAIKAKFREAGLKIKTVTVDIDSHALQTFDQVKLRVQPIINTVNELNTLSKPHGVSGWAKLIDLAAQIALTALAPGLPFPGREFAGVTK